MALGMPGYLSPFWGRSALLFHRWLFLLSPWDSLPKGGFRSAAHNEWGQELVWMSQLLGWLGEATPGNELYSQSPVKPDLSLPFTNTTWAGSLPWLSSSLPAVLPRIFSQLNFLHSNLLASRRLLLQVTFKIIHSGRRAREEGQRLQVKEGPAPGCCRQSLLLWPWWQGLQQCFLWATTPRSDCWQTHTGEALQQPNFAAWRERDLAEEIRSGYGNGLADNEKTLCHHNMLAKKGFLGSRGPDLYRMTLNRWKL